MKESRDDLLFFLLFFLTLCFLCFCAVIDGRYGVGKSEVSQLNEKIDKVIQLLEETDK